MQTAVNFLLYRLERLEVTVARLERKLQAERDERKVMMEMVRAQQSSHCEDCRFRQGNELFNCPPF